MAAPTITQQHLAYLQGTPYVYTLPGVTAGATLVAIGCQTVSATRNGSVSDNKGNTWTTKQQGTSRYSFMGYATDVAGGDTQITLSVVNFSTTFRLLGLFEIAASTFDVWDSLQSTSNQTTHYAAPSGEIDTSADVLCFIAGAHNSIANPSPSTGWTEQSSDSSAIIATKSFSAAQNDERGQWTTSNARHSYAIIASFAAAASSSPLWLPKILEGPQGVH